MKNLLGKVKPRLFPLGIIVIIEAIFLVLVWFIADINRAGRIDRFFLYYVDDVFRYCYIKALLVNPIISLNYYCKIGYALISVFFYNILPFGISSLRIMNTLFSCGILILTYKLARLLSFTRFSSGIMILLLTTFPVYFLLSLTTLSEVMYSFFIILAVFLLYSQKYNLSIFLVAFLPLIRQEGLLYIVIWIYLFHKQIKIKQFIFICFPTLLWAILNNQFLGHNFSKFFFYLPTKDPYNSMATPEGFGNLIRIFILHPLIILSLVGFLITLKDKSYRFLKACFVAQASFLIIFQTIHFLDSGGFFCREMRILMPLLPLASLYAGKSIDKLVQQYNLSNRVFLFGAMVMLITIMVFQVSKLQHDPVVINDFVSSGEESVIKDASSWLNVYLHKEKINKVCIVPGALITDKIIRRIWMYLPGDINFYADGNEKMSISDNVVFDPAVLKDVILPKDIKYLFISKNKLNTDVLGCNLKSDLIKSYPDISVYFYSVIYN